MCESLVGFSHSVGIFFLFERSTFTFACCYDLTSELFGHASTVSVPAVADQPLDAEGNFAVWTNFRWDLESCTTDTAASYFHSGRNVRQGPLPDVISVFTSLLSNTIHCIIENVESGIL